MVSGPYRPHPRHKGSVRLCGGLDGTVVDVDFEWCQHESRRIQPGGRFGGKGDGSGYPLSGFSRVSCYGDDAAATGPSTRVLPRVHVLVLPVLA